MSTPIIGNAFTLRFDTRTEDVVARVMAIDGESLMARLTERGFVAFRLRWEDAFEAQLAIEDDVAFICDAVNELEGFATGVQDHYVHLGDGELEITSRLSEGVVSTSIEFTPHLDRRFHVQYEFRSTLQQYMLAWQSLLISLMSMVK